MKYKSTKSQKTMAPVSHTPYTTRHTSASAFTLIETLVAITVLVIALISPMSLATQSLRASLYARDQVVASHLAQEGIELVRALRDANALKIGHGVLDSNGNPYNLMSGIPIGVDFTVDTSTGQLKLCSDYGLTNGACPPLRVSPVDTVTQFYGYDSSWNITRYTRIIRAEWVRDTEEMKVTVTVSWQTGAIQTRTITITENLYRWVDTGTAS